MLSPNNSLPLKFSLAVKMYIHQVDLPVVRKEEESRSRKAAPGIMTILNMTKSKQYSRCFQHEILVLCQGRFLPSGKTNHKTLERGSLQ